MDRDVEYRKINWVYHEAIVTEGRMVYYFYALTDWGLRRKVQRYFKCG